MGSLMRQKEATARKKGTVATLTAVAGLGLMASGAWVLGVPVLGFGAYLGYDWFMFRAKNGMRF